MVAAGSEWSKITRNASFLKKLRPNVQVRARGPDDAILALSFPRGHCFVEIVTTSQSINELNYFPNCDTLQARQPFGNYSVLLYLYFTVIIFLIRLLCVTYRFRTTLTKNKQQFETHGFGCVSQQNIRNQMNHHG